MDAHPTPSLRDLVLLGGGHTHALVLRMLGMEPLPGVRVTVVSDVSAAPYSGMLPGHVAGFYSWDEMHIDLRRLSAFAGATFVLGRVEGLDLANRRVHVAGRPPLAADVVSLNVGATPRRSVVPGAEEHAIPSKPVPELLAGWERVKAAAAESPSGQPLRVVLVGGGAGGVELAVTMHHQLGGRAAFTILHQGPHVLPGHNRRVRAIFDRLLAERGIAVRTATRVAAVTATAVCTAAGEQVPADFVFWVTQAAAAEWIAASGLAVAADGSVRVAPTLQALGHPWLFAAGDVATVEGEPRPKSGVFAVRMARPLAANLRAHFAGRPLQPYRPQRQFLSLIGTGDGQAVASRRYLAGRSAFFWRLKDRIDRRFMAKFEDLPAMADGASGAGVASGRAGDDGTALAELTERARMRCLGCAAKLGGGLLGRVLDRLREEHGTAWLEAERCGTVLAGLATPDDAAVFPVPAGRALVQSVDFLPAPVSDPYLFGRIATLHGLSDLYAMGAEPHSALAAAQIPFAADALMEETLYQLLSGVLRELGGAGALLLGGHSAEGAVLGLGLTVNGLVEPDRLLRKGGLRLGDALVLTKPLGTGVLFAAHMRRAARARWIDAALASMLVSNRAAAEILRAQGAAGVTDVTGFGLAGHLLEMLRSAGLGAEVDLAAVPALPGALDCLGRGFASSLHAANHAALVSLAGPAAGHRAFPLLFDPQTSGGLLAGVPADRADACVAALRAAGAGHAAVIGRVVVPADPTAPLTLL